MYRFEFIEFNDKKLLIKRIIPEHKLKPNPDVSILKQWTMSDIILKKDGHYYCCAIIEEAEIIEEITY